jgi:hypothetical protein
VYHLAEIDWYSIRQAFEEQAKTIAAREARDEKDIEIAAVEIAQKVLVGFTEKVKTTLQKQPPISEIVVFSRKETQTDYATYTKAWDMIMTRLLQQGLSPHRRLTDDGDMGIALLLDDIKEKAGL